MCLFKIFKLSFYCFFSVSVLVNEIWGLNLDSTAEKTNIPWRDMTKEILESDVYKEKDVIEDSSIVYPDCNFLNPMNISAFHACLCLSVLFLYCINLAYSKKLLLFLDIYLRLTCCLNPVFL